jgi:hypothetical protein
MPDVYGPFTAQTWTQAQWFRDAYARDVSGVYGTSFANAAAGDLGLTVSGLIITMGLGRAHVRGAGYERTGTAWSYTVPANTATNPRIDRLVLRRDLAAGTVLPTPLQGTAAATPAEPALTQAEDGVWDLPLHSWTTPANSGAPLTAVTDERQPAGVGAVGRDVARSSGAAAVATTVTNWTVNAGSWARRVAPGLAWVFVDVTYTGGTAITVPADGNIPGTAVATLLAAWRPLDSQTLTSSTVGAMAVGLVDSAGNVSLEAVPPGVTISNGYRVNLSGLLVLP